ncbi:MAG: sigma-70 family RNA polymerase sigma factor [Rhodanobacteraceae bacterium]
MTQLPSTRGGIPPGRIDAATDEAVLIARVVMRDQDAFEMLYRAYYPKLRQFVLRMTRRPALVEDVFNETMLAVWRKARSYNGGSRVSTWIYAIAYRQALKALRRNDEPLEQHDPDALRSPGHEPDRELQQHQWRGHLQAAMAALSPEHRAVIELTYFHDYACRDVAAIVQCPVATVKTRMFYARRRLKTLLAALAEEVS